MTAYICPECNSPQTVHPCPYCRPAKYASSATVWEAVQRVMESSASTTLSSNAMAQSDGSEPDILTVASVIAHYGLAQEHQARLVVEDLERPVELGLVVTVGGYKWAPARTKQPEGGRG